MSRQFNGASSQYLAYGGGLITSPPFTLAAWFRVTTDGYNQWMFSTSMTTSDDNSVGLAARMDLAGDPLQFGIRDAVGWLTVPSTTGCALDAWQHACGVCAASNSRAIYLNGGSKGTSTDTRNPTGMNITSIGMLRRLAPAAPFYGRIAWPCIWNVALSDSEVAQLASGLPPWCIRPSNIVALWDLTRNVSPETCYPGYGSYDMTLYNGPTYSTDDPPVGAIPWSRRASGIWTPGRR